MDHGHRKVLPGKSRYQKLATMVSRSKRFSRCHREGISDVFLQNVFGLSNRAHHYGSSQTGGAYSTVPGNASANPPPQVIPAFAPSRRPMGQNDQFNKYFLSDRV